MFWVIQALNGISFGMLLFLLAAGLSLIYGLMKILNLTHGSFYMLGGYIGLVVIHATGSFILAVLAGSLAVAVIGVLMERFLLRRFHLQELPQTLVTFGLLFIFSDLAIVIWGGNPVATGKNTDVMLPMQGQSSFDTLTAAHLIIDLRAVDELAQPLLSVSEPVRAGRQRDPRRLAPSDQASALSNPREGVRDRDLAVEALARIGDGRASHQQTV